MPAIALWVVQLDGPRVLPDQQIGQVADGAGDAERAAVVAAFAPAHEALIGLDPHEGPRPPAAVTVQGLDTPDLHDGVLLPDRAPILRRQEAPLRKLDAWRKIARCSAGTKGRHE
jgi:hypothetical protein